MLNVKTYFCLHNKFSNIIDGGMAIEAINILIARFEVYETSLDVWDEEVQHKDYQRPDPPSAHARVTSTFQRYLTVLTTITDILHRFQFIARKKKEDKKTLYHTRISTLLLSILHPPESLYKFTKSKLTGQGYLNEKA